MTSTLLVLGDSLMDAGNVSRATDGLVLGEQIAFEMGGDPEDVQLFPLEDLPRPAPPRLGAAAQLCPGRSSVRVRIQTTGAGRSSTG